MSTLSSSSTYTQIVAAYMDNASYEEDGSAAKAKAFITAVRMLIRHPKRSRTGSSNGAGQEMEHDLETLRAELADARDFVAANETVTGTRTTYGDFQNFRN